MVNARAKNVSKGMLLENFWVAVCGRLPNGRAQRFQSEVENCVVA